ncbi:hypothetical protein C1H46_008062 [Malus baccata]|uniref:Eukaryotic translation initiation factor 4G n=1 Tax=Malus baccata TaxID=106549 RepID=A0A540N5N9_MALBA|nr:hypothetical protein C1H46_008062 [Malus baccata]
MSFNQSTSDKNKTQYRKTGRSASSNQQHRGYSPAYPKGTGATASVTSISPQVSGMAPAQRGGVQNGAHAQPQLHGGSDVPIASTAPQTASTAPQTAEASAPQRSSRIVPKPPTSQSVSVTSDTRKPTTPAKPPGDASKGVAIQPGSISPGFMNGIQPPMGPQMPQMGNLGISMASQCPQQQGSNFGVLRSPCAPTPVQQHVRGILPGPAHSVGHQGGMQRNISDADRWQRATNFQPKGLMPSPHTPLQVMHQADRKNEDAESGGMDASLSRSDSMGGSEVFFSKSSKLEQHSSSVQTTELSGRTSKTETEGTCEENIGGGEGNIENIGSGGDSRSESDFRDKPELNRTKSTISRGKKKRKEILSKADAAGVTSDLYGAYKNPEEKKDIENTESIMTSIISKQVATDAPQQDAVGRERDAPVKAEPEDWEDAADISTLKLETSDTGELVCGVDDSDKDGHELGAKKYSRDFLLKFSVQFTELPEGFEIMSDIAEILDANVNAAPSIDYDSLPSPGRIVDRQGGAARLDRRGSGIMDDDRWNKGGATNFRTGQGPNFGVLRNPRAPTSVQQHVRGILPGPAHSVGHQGGMQRNNSDADRWQRATNFQPKGLMPSPHTPLQVMHKADRKYEVGKVSDEEQAKQRQLKAILNKLTPQNFEKLFKQVKAVNIDNATTLTGVISQIFDKALMEPTLCEMYANFCFYLAGELPDFSEDNEKITFKRLLLNKCQEEFERGEREQEEANKADEEGQVKQSEEEREEKRIKAQRQMLGNIRLIGELYKKKMLTERIMHECIKKMLGQQQIPDGDDIEALCKLMSTIGEMIDRPKAKEHMDAYFESMKSLSNNMKLSSRVRFMLKDAIDLRKNKWQQRSKVEGPKKIEEVQRDAAQELQAQSSRLARGPGINPSARRWPPSPRGSTMLPSPNVCSFDRTLPTSPPTRAHGAALTQNAPSENVLTEDRLRDKSLAAIKEFYSARDEKEVALCIKELNSPSFHPSMISLWITDSFERKDAERDLLAKLLVNLTKTNDATLSQSQLIKGFETVLSTLEDAVIDTPRAPEFLGLIFAKVILENVVSLNQIGQLIQEGGEEPRHLLEVGLAGNILGNVLEIIKSEKGDNDLNDIRTSSNLRLETFRPPDPLKSRILEKFI